MNCQLWPALSIVQGGDAVPLNTAVSAHDQEGVETTQCLISPTKMEQKHESWCEG